MSGETSNKPWGGVFSGATDPRVERFTQSVSFDRRLAEQDIRGSIAHARMLAGVGSTASSIQSYLRGFFF